MQNGKSCSQITKPAGKRAFWRRIVAMKFAYYVHDQRNPLFLFYSMHLVHMPLQIPSEYEEKFSFIPDRYRRLNHAMAYFMDQKVGDIVEAYSKNGTCGIILCLYSIQTIRGWNHGGWNMWRKQLPVDWRKICNWEGGIRVNAFIAGGIIPEGKRGTREDKSYITAWDWYAYVCIFG